MHVAKPSDAQIAAPLLHALCMSLGYFKEFSMKQPHKLAQMVKVLQLAKSFEDPRVHQSAV